MAKQFFEQALYFLGYKMYKIGDYSYDEGNAFVNYSIGDYFVKVWGAPGEWWIESHRFPETGPLNDNEIVPLLVRLLPLVKDVSFISLPRPLYIANP